MLQVYQTSFPVFLAGAIDLSVNTYPNKTIVKPLAKHIHFQDEKVSKI